jgi:hypothetical protein
MSRPVLPCQHPGCARQCEAWRQCPDNACRADIVYCAEHGGDERAEDEMTAHIEHEHR